MNTSNYVTINLFLWVSSSVQIWKPPSLLSFFFFFVAAFFGFSDCSFSLLWDSFSVFSPVSTLKIKHSKVIVLFLCTSNIIIRFQNERALTALSIFHLSAYISSLHIPSEAKYSYKYYVDAAVFSRHSPKLCILNMNIKLCQNVWVNPSTVYIYIV